MQEGAKQTCMDSEIWCSLRSTDLKSCSVLQKHREALSGGDLPGQVLCSLADRI